VFPKRGKQVTVTGWGSDFINQSVTSPRDCHLARETLGRACELQAIRQWKSFLLKLVADERSINVTISKIVVMITVAVAPIAT
jgi:hypothetical protein